MPGSSLLPLTPSLKLGFSLAACELLGHVVRCISCELAEGVLHAATHNITQTLLEILDVLQQNSSQSSRSTCYIMLSCSVDTYLLVRRRHLSNGILHHVRSLVLTHGFQSLLLHLALQLGRDAEAV